MRVHAPHGASRASLWRASNVAVSLSPPRLEPVTFEKFLRLRQKAAAAAEGS